MNKQDEVKLEELILYANRVIADFEGAGADYNTRLYLTNSLYTTFDCLVKLHGSIDKAIILFATSNKRAHKYIRQYLADKHPKHLEQFEKPILLA